MSMVGTFDGFTAARLGIYAAQHSLQVTGNNISNINTPGYTRQRVDQYSLKVGGNDVYKSHFDNHIGSGALIKSISQIRDPYLDIRFRNISTETYHQDTWLAGLQGIASILDEVGKGENEGDGLLYAQIQDLVSKLRTYGSNPTSLNERLVRDSASSLTALFNNAAKRLEDEMTQTRAEFYDNIDVVNQILTSIRDLNKSIRDSEIHGDTALEMRDERNRQIDALSQYLDISVEYSFEDIGSGVQVEKLTIKLNNANPDGSVHSDESILVDGLFATQLSVPEEKPTLNTYKDQPLYSWYMKGYTYMRVVADDGGDGTEALNQFMSKHGLIGDDLIPNGKDENGNNLYIIGTNDPDVEGIITEKNDNYTIQLGKLTNDKGVPWKSSETRWTEVPGKPVYYNTWAYTVESTLGDGGIFKIGDKEYYIVDGDYDPDDVPENAEVVHLYEIAGSKFADYVADKLEKDGKYDGKYKVTSKGGQIIFTAVDPGPDTEGPDLTVYPDNAGVYLDKTPTKDQIVKYESPADPNVEYPLYTTDEHGQIIQAVNYTYVGNKWYKVQIDTEYTHNIALDDNDLRGILQAQRELLTEEGEFSSKKDVTIDENALTKRGIPYYMKSLDLLAQKFAEAFNQLNKGYAYNQNGNYIDKDGKELMLDEMDADGTVTDSKPISSTNGLTEGQMRNLIFNNGTYGYIRTDAWNNFVDENGNVITDEDGNALTADTITPKDYNRLVVDMDKMMGKVEDGGLGGWEMGGVLFSNRGDNNDTSGITAKNIAISYDWSNGKCEVVRTFEMLFADDGSGGLTNSTQPSGINHMIAMLEKSLTYDPRDLNGSDAIGPVLFEGNFNDMFSNMMAVEAEDASITKVKLTANALALDDLDYAREGVSGVDLNDEAMNMVTYQKAMTAAMRLMTAIDEVLDRLINNTGLAGR